MTAENTAKIMRRAGLALALSALLARPALAETRDLVDDDGDTGSVTLAHELSVCAAYYFNATNVARMTEYEEVYSAGERAFNGAVEIIGREAVDNAMAEASAEMTALMAQNWMYFHRVDDRYRASCAELVPPADE